MLRSFRTRLAATVVLLVGVTATSVGVLSFVLVEQSLRNQLIAGAVAQADFNIGVLASADVLPQGADSFEFEASGLADRFLQRGVDGLYVEFDDDNDPYPSRIALLDAGARLAPGLRELVSQGRLGYGFMDVADESFLVVGGRRPPAGPDFYFFFSSAEIGDALGQLRRVLIGAGVAVVLLAAVASRFISRGVLRPVRTASDAAATMAAGDLSVRLPAESDDEFGDWAESFNQMAASLEEKVGELQAAQAREKRFVADVSHELRTPLTALVTEAAMAQGILQNVPGGERIGELLESDIARLRRLVEDLLEISRLDAAPDASALDDVAVRPFLEAVIGERHPATVLDAPDVKVRCDRHGLERIVANLLDNARLHAPDAEVAVAARVADSWLHMKVADRGPGVPGDALERIFERFATADEARGRGSGLGLAIARQHAERMGGELTAHPNPGGGLVLEVAVPVTDLLHDRDPAEKRRSHPDGETTDSPRRKT